MSEYLHQWSHWVTGHPHIQFLFMCPVKNYIIIGCLPRQMTLVSPLQTGKCLCRHQWDIIVIRPSAVGDMSCTRRPECGDDPSTARNGWLPLYDETADRVEVDRCMTTSGGPYGTQRWGLAITHCEVCQPQSRRVITCWSLRGFTICNSNQRNLVSNPWTLFNTPTQ